MFNKLRSRIVEKVQGFDFELTIGCYDVYSMANKLKSFREDLDKLQADADRLVKEIERGNNAEL